MPGSLHDSLINEDEDEGEEESNSSDESYNKIDPTELAAIRKEAIEIQSRINQNRDSEMQKIRQRRSKCPTHSNCSSCKGSVLRSRSRLKLFVSELNLSGVQPTRCTHTVQALRSKFKESGRQIGRTKARECEAFDDISMNAATSRHFKVSKTFCWRLNNLSLEFDSFLYYSFTTCFAAAILIAFRGASIWPCLLEASPIPLWS